MTDITHHNHPAFARNDSEQRMPDPQLHWSRKCCQPFSTTYGSKNIVPQRLCCADHTLLGGGPPPRVRACESLTLREGATAVHTARPGTSRHGLSHPLRRVLPGCWLREGNRWHHFCCDVSAKDERWGTVVLCSCAACLHVRTGAATRAGMAWGIAATLMAPKP
jgi:hypothetical protein